MAELSVSESEHTTLLQKLLLLGSSVFDGALGVLAALIPNVFVSIVLLLAACLLQFVFIWKLHFFGKHRIKGNAAIWVIVVAILWGLWWTARPSPQPPAVTRADVREEITEAVKQIVPLATVTPTPLPVLTPSPTPLATLSKRKKKTAPKLPRCSAEDRLLGRC